MSASNPEQKSAEKALQKENKVLRGEIKQLEIKIKTIQGDLNKSTVLKDRLEGLCRELQKQNRFIKAESSAKIAEANAKGKELAQEVQNNMGFMKNINQNLASITSESLEVKRENEDLAKKIATLKDHYEEREKILQTALSETNALLLLAKQELGEFKLKNAEEKEKLYGEMQQLANALVQSREQMKEAKETEITLRNLIQNYDDKFNGLQKALKDTNGAYDEFKSEMSKVTGRTKELEKETSKWQNRWEESNTALSLMEKNHHRLQGELVKAQESLAKMTNLCRALQVERKELLSELKVEEEKRGIVKTKPDEAELQLTERAKIVDDINHYPSQDKIDESSTVVDSDAKVLLTSASNGDPTITSIDKSPENLPVSAVELNTVVISNGNNKTEDSVIESSNDESASNTNSTKPTQKGINKSAPTSPSKSKNKKSQNKNQSQPCSPSKKESHQAAEAKEPEIKENAALPEKLPKNETVVTPTTQESQINPEDNVPTVVVACESSSEDKIENKPVVSTEKELEKRNMDSPSENVTLLQNDADMGKPENIVKSNSNPTASPKSPNKDTPKCNKKGQSTPKPNSAEEALPKPNKKSKKHK